MPFSNGNAYKRGAEAEVAQGGFSIGSWQVETDLNRIRSGRFEVTLEPKVMRLLVELSRQPGNPVSRPQLHEALWGEVHVADGALKHLVWELRRALGDDAKKPRYIETIPKKGYRLVAPVLRRPADPPTLVVEPRARRLGATFLVFTAAVILVGLLWNSRSDADEAADAQLAARLQIRPLTTWPGNEIDPQLSPDGHLVAYSWDEKGGESFDIYVQEVRGDRRRRLTHDPARDTTPTWSPDGRLIAFARSGAEGVGQVLLIPVTGGKERRLIDDSLGRVTDLAWGSRQDGLVAAIRPKGDHRTRLAWVSYPEAQVRWLTSPPDRSSGDRDPTISPDGSRVAFQRRFYGRGGDIFSLRLPAGEPVRHTADNSVIFGLTYTPDGRGLIFSSDRVAPRSLWKLDLESRDLQWYPFTMGFPADPSMAPGGNGLVYQQMLCDSNIRLARAKGEDFEPVESVVASNLLEHSPRFSPDGGRLAFVSTRSGHTEIWTTDLRGGQPRQLTRLRGPIIQSVRWSSDGQELVFDARTRQGTDIYAVGLSALGERRLTDHAANEVAPSLSSDGKTLFFGSDRSGRWQIWKKGEAGLDEQVTLDDGFAALADRESQYIYYTRRDEPGLWRKRLGEGRVPEKRVIEGLSTTDGLNWDLNRKGLYFISSVRGRPVVAFSDFTTGQKRIVLGLDQWSPYPGLSVSPDGSALAYTRLDSSSSDLMSATLP